MSTAHDPVWLLSRSPHPEEQDATAFGRDVDEPQHEQQAELAEQGYYYDEAEEDNEDDV